MKDNINNKTPFTVYADSRQGGRAENQDTYGYSDTQHGMLMLVCDGMGGGPSGKLASKIAAESIINFISKADTETDRTELLKNAIVHAHNMLLENVNQNPANKGMGTTVAALLINEDSAIVAHVGDSRVYQFRNGGKKFRTFDHSAVFERMCSAPGKIKDKDVERARRSGSSNVITRALGHGTSIQPDICRLSYEKGDRFLLCSDGIWGIQEEKEIIKIAAKTRTPSGVIESFMVVTDDIGKASGGRHDNFTAMITQTTINSKYKEKMSKRHKIMMLILGGLFAISAILNVVLYNSLPQNGATSPNIQSEDVERMVKEQVREETRKMEDKFKSDLDSIQKTIISDPDKGEEIIEAKTSTISLAQEIDAIISTLNELSDMPKGEDRKSRVNETKLKLKDLQEEIVSHGIDNSSIENIINELGKQKSVNNEDSKKTVKGHYNEIIRNLEKIREKLSH